MSLIIKEYIDLIVEKIYSVDKKNQFKLNDLKSLNNLRDIQDYTRNKLKKLGEGTAREVYLLNTGKVLKIALDRYDTEQNEGEVFASARFGDLVPSVYEWDPNYNWIITELVKPLENNPESENIFKLKSGLSFNDYDDFIKYHSFGTSNKKEELKKSRLMKNGFIKKLIDADSQGLDILDSTKLFQWGIDSEGRLKYLDPGLSYFGE